MISVAQAFDLIISNTPQLSTTLQKIELASGFVLAEDIFSDIDMPPFDKSMMDGYAVRSADCTEPETVLSMSGFIPAGTFPDFTLEKGQAAKIMTGAPLPRGADAVLQIELTEANDDKYVRLLRPVTAAQNVIKRAREVAEGAHVAQAGTLITPRVVGLLASVGKEKVQVFKQPKIAILSTGDELVSPPEKPKPGEIRNSNSYTLAAYCAEMGLRFHMLGIAKDKREIIERKIRQGLEYDMLLVTGGVSMGDLDYVGEIIQKLNMQVYFENVAIKPGKPTVFATFGEKLIFGLPGNPVSGATVFDVLVRPAIRKMMGLTAYQNQIVQSTLTDEFKNKSNRENYHPCVTKYRKGAFFSQPLVTRGSGDVTAYSRCNSYLICPKDEQDFKKGQSYSVLLMDNYYLT